MNLVSGDHYAAMCKGARVLEADSFGEKVLLLTDGTMIKLFRRKRWLSSAAWYPYAQRFADNAASLEQRGVPVPEVLAVFRVPAIERDAVHYRPLAGCTLRELRRAVLDQASEDQLRQGLARFVVYLHDNGIYFRSLHLGNVIYTPDQRFGLIDLADARLYPRPLRQFERLRNLRRLEANPDEKEWVAPVRAAIVG